MEGMDTTHGPGLELSVTYYMTETALAFCLTKIYRKQICGVRGQSVAVERKGRSGEHIQ